MVKQHIDQGDKISTSEEVARLAVVKNLKNNYSYMTIYDNNGKWKRGEEVRKMDVGQSEFITTDPNETKKDKLKKLHIQIHYIPSQSNPDDIIFR